VRPCPRRCNHRGQGFLRTLEGHAGAVNAVAVTPGGRRVVSASDDQTLKVWELERNGYREHSE